MFRALRQIAVSVAVAVMLLCVTSAYADGPDIAGRYRCEGQNPAGGKYIGIVVIRKNEDTYRVQWSVGQQQYSGIGLLEAGALSVGWIAPGGAAGVVVYKVEKDGKTMSGRWAVFGSNKKYDETLTRIDPDACAK